MNVLPALQNHLQQHHPHQWHPVTVHHNNYTNTIQTTTHNNGITTHIEIIQRDTTLQIEHTTYTNNTTYTKKHATISLLDPEFLHKIDQIVGGTPP